MIFDDQKINYLSLKLRIKGIVIVVNNNSNTNNKDRTLTFFMSAQVSPLYL